MSASASTIARDWLISSREKRAQHNTVSVALASIVSAPLMLLFPNSAGRANFAKLAILGTVFATFFLFAGRIWLPGGATQFMAYADAIIHHTTLPTSVAQRDAGYPLIIILSGYTVSHSLIPLILIQAAFAIALPLLIYESLRRLSIGLAFLIGLGAILTLSPFIFMKMIHHDQTYIFFSVLTTCTLLMFVQARQLRFLYLFTIAAILASIARPAGNILFPIFLVAAYLAVRGSVRHYLLCTVIFVAALAAYSWHRYIIFDMKHVGANASYTGEQIFYDPYVNSLDYGIHLVPSQIGPQFAYAVDRLHQQLQPAPKHSRFIRGVYDNSSYARQFADANMNPLTADQLIEKVLTSPNYEFYSLLCDANDDQTMLGAAWEMYRAYPGLIVRYSLRNLIHFIFNPGYQHSRFNFNPFGPEGLIFWPGFGNLWPSDFDLLPPRAAREARFDSISGKPVVLGNPFNWLQQHWLRHYRQGVIVAAVFICLAWFTAIAALGIHLLSRISPDAISKRYPTSVFAGSLATSIIVASLVFGYNAAITALFAEPGYRYRELVDLQATLIAGLGMISLYRWLSFAFLDRLISPFAKSLSAISNSLSALDIWEQRTKTELTLFVIGLTVAGFGWWAVWMIKNTTV